MVDVWIIDCLRWYVVVVSVLVAVAGGLQWRRWSSFKPENQLAWLAIVALNFSAFVGCLESLLFDVPGGARTFVLVVAETWLLVAVTFHPVTGWRARRQASQVDD